MFLVYRFLEPYEMIDIMILRVFYFLFQRNVFWLMDSLIRL